MSASETTPITFPSSSTTGKALTRSWRSLAAISLNDAPRLTATTWVVMMSLTLVFIVIVSFLVEREAGPGAEGSGILGGQVAEAIADGHHPLHVPDPADNLVTELVVLRYAGQRHHAVLDRHREGVRVGEKPIEDHVAGDFLADFLVRAVKDGKDVGAADDSRSEEHTSELQSPCNLVC